MSGSNIYLPRLQELFHFCFLFFSFIPWTGKGKRHRGMQESPDIISSTPNTLFSNHMCVRTSCGHWALNLKKIQFEHSSCGVEDGQKCDNH